MAWTRVILIKDDCAEDRNGAMKGQKVFYVESDVPVSVTAALAATLDGETVSERGEAFSGERPRCVCTDRRVERINGNSPFHLHVYCDFEDPTDGSATEDLLGKPARISTSDEHGEEAYQKDGKGNLVRNKAGEVPSVFPTRDSGVTVYTIKKYVTSSTRTAIRAVKKTLNQADVTIDGDILLAGTAALFESSFEPVDDAGGVYDATILVKHNPTGWKDKLMNVGFSELVDGKRVPILEQDEEDGNWHRVATPWPLNEDGSAKANSTDPVDLIDFYPYAESEWPGVPLS